MYWDTSGVLLYMQSYVPTTSPWTIYEMLSVLPNRYLSGWLSLLPTTAHVRTRVVLERVPPELLEDILLLSVSASGRPWQPLSSTRPAIRRRLLSLALVCKRWAAVALPLAYQFWDTYTDDEPSLVVPPPRLAGFVRALTVEDPSGHGLFLAKLEGHVFAFAASCLTACDSIQELTVGVRVWNEEQHFEQLVQAIARSNKLRKFTFRTIANGRDMIQLNPAHLARIAEAAPQLESTCIVDLTQAADTLQSPSFPPLRELKSLVLHDADIEDATLRAILRSTPKLQELHVAYEFYGSHSSTGLVETLSLVSDTLITLNMQRVGDLSSAEGWQLESLLPTFQHLRSFTFLQKRWDGPPIFRGSSTYDQGTFDCFPPKLRHFRIASLLYGMDADSLQQALAALPKSRDKWSLSFAMQNVTDPVGRYAHAAQVNAMRDACGEIGFRVHVTNRREYMLVDCFEV